VIAPARAAAYEVVRRVFEQDAYADRAFRTAASALDDRDRALAQRLAYGTIQRVRTIDHAIDELGRRKVRKLDAPVLAALRLGAYQLGWADQIPAHAAVSDSVELVRRAGLERAVAFANAVLRRLSEGLSPLLEALPEGPLLHSYPDWIFEVWERDLCREDALALMRAQNEVVEPLAPHEISRASKLAAACVGEGGRIADLCAAPGGKTDLLRGDEIVAVELHEGRARELAERFAGRPEVRVVNADVRELHESGFDRVLLDAPCSGLGVLSRRPDLRWRARPLPELQLELLRAAAERVRPGGTIVYSVCTINADENEAVVDASGLEPEPLGDEHPEFRHPRRPEFLLTLPHVHATSGFFISRLRA
jgi:16S rRNA (cytosine967-C5)-methyltransferase